MGATRQSKFKRIIKKDGITWLIMLPTLTLFAFFVWHPLLSNIYLSFHETTGFDAGRFTGFDNYIAVLSNDLFLTALWNTVLYTFWSLIIGFILPIFLAILLSEVIHLRSFFKSGLYIPSIIPAVASGIMWVFLMDPAPGSLFNTINGWFGNSPSLLLDNPNIVIPLIVLSMTWKGAGATMLIYFATIQTIDQTQYEATMIEGGGVWHRLRYVTIPALLPNIKILLLLQIISVFQLFQEPLIMTDRNGGVNNSALSLLQLIYRYVYGAGQIQAGHAAALGVIVSLILISLTLVYLKISKGRGEQ